MNYRDEFFTGKIALFIYGIVASEYDYNDYQSVEVEGKIDVMLSGKPAGSAALSLDWMQDSAKYC